MALTTIYLYLGDIKNENGDLDISASDSWFCLPNLSYVLYTYPLFARNDAVANIQTYWAEHKNRRSTKWFAFYVQISPKTKQSLNLAAEVEKAICLFSRPQIAFDGRQIADYKTLKLAVYA